MTLDILSEILNDCDDDVRNRLLTPDWESARPDDWEMHIPQSLRELWHHLDLEAKATAFITAELAASRQESRD